MRISQAWLFPLVIGVALAAGVTAFLLAVPDQSTRPSGSELGFAALAPTGITASLAHAAANHRAAASSAREGAAATARARAWFEALPADPRASAASSSVVRVAPGDDRGARRVQAFVRWGDDLPSRSWRVTTAAATPLVDEPGHWTVDATVQVDVAQAQDRVRRHELDVTLELEASAARTRGLPRAWAARDVRVTGNGSWLRAYPDPVVVRAGTIDVVAPAAEVDRARTFARIAAESFTGASTVYGAAGGVSTITVWLVPGIDRLGSITGRAPTPQERASQPGDPHHAAWVDIRGDVLVDLSRLDASPPGTHEGQLRHATARSATSGVAAGAPPLLTEGIALAESRRVGDRIVLDPQVLARLDAAFTSRTSGIAIQVAARPGRALAPRHRDAAAATVAWMLDDRGATRTAALFDSLAAGTDPDTALRRTLGLTPRGVELQVARWVRAALPAPEAPTTLQPGANTEEPRP